MPTRSRLAHAAILALVFTLTPACFAADASKLPVWKPDPKIVSGLGDDYALYGSALRLPDSFTLTKTHLDPKVDIRLWDGIPYGNGFHAEFVSLAVPLPPDAQGASPAQIQQVQDELFAVGKDILASEFSDWIQSQPQQGDDNGQTLDRLYFKAFDQRVLREIHGFLYTTATSKCIYGFLAADIEPYNKMSLPVLEASVLTFHPSSAQTAPVPSDLLNNLPVEEDNQ